MAETAHDELGEIYGIHSVTHLCAPYSSSRWMISADVSFAFPFPFIPAVLDTEGGIGIVEDDA